MGNECITVVWTFFVTALLWDGMKTDLFQSCGHCCIFQICWHTECSILTASSFRILNSPAGIPSPPLALFAVMLPKAHLTSHSRMSGSSWVTTPSWLSWSLRPFCIVFLCILATSSFFLLLLGLYHFCPLSCPSLHEMFPWCFHFSWRDLYSFPFYRFPLLLCIVHLRKSYLSFVFSVALHSVGYIFPFFLCLSLFFFPVVICKVLCHKKWHS